MGVEGAGWCRWASSSSSSFPFPRQPMCSLSTLGCLGFRRLESMACRDRSGKKLTLARASGIKLDPCRYRFRPVSSEGVGIVFWHGFSVAGVGDAAGFCKAVPSFGDECHGSFGERAEEVAFGWYFDDSRVDDDAPIAPVQVGDDAFFEAACSDENSAVHEDLKASVRNWEFPQSLFARRSPSFKNENNCDRVTDGENMTSSLRMLKERAAKTQNQSPMSRCVNKDLKEKFITIGESFRRAFSSMVFMIRTLQGHTLHIRQLLFCEDLQGVVNMVQKEMHLSLVWLFQRVYSCTPKLMLLVMVLLADFTVFSLHTNMALATTVSPTPSSALVSVSWDGLDSLKAGTTLPEAGSADNSCGGYFLESTKLSAPSVDGEFSQLNNEGAGTGGGLRPKVVGGTDGDACTERVAPSRAMYREDDAFCSCISHGNGAVEAQGQPHLQLGDMSLSSKKVDPALGETNLQVLRHFVQEASEEIKSRSVEFSVVLDEDTMQRLVAPVKVQLEPDDYVCYDRTDLLYQHAINVDCDNPMLLANYAQFLYLVRHDLNRAEELFRRAMRADPVDAEIIGRFASFLWLARGNHAAAEMAFRAAIAADPNNPFHAGSYAHFLWNCGEETSCSIAPTA